MQKQNQEQSSKTMPTYICMGELTRLSQSSAVQQQPASQVQQMRIHDFGQEQGKKTHCLRSHLITFRFMYRNLIKSQPNCFKYSPFV